MTRRIGLTAAGFILLFGFLGAQQPSEQKPYQATGFKICEVDQTSAIIWARLTRNRERVGKEGPMPIVRYRDPATGELRERGQGGRRPDREPVVEFPDGSTVGTIEGRHD